MGRYQRGSEALALCRGGLAGTYTLKGETKKFDFEIRIENENFEQLCALKKKIFAEGITDPKKVEENEYWLQKYVLHRARTSDEAGARVLSAPSPGGAQGALRHASCELRCVAL